MVGRIIGVFCCMIGIFILSLLVVTLLIYTILNTDEERAFREIDTLYTKSHRNNFVTKYSHAYIKHKMFKWKKSQKLKNYFSNKNNYKLNHARNFLKIKNLSQEPFDVIGFCKSSREIWDDDTYEIKDKISMSVDKIIPNVQNYSRTAVSMLNDSKASKVSSFKMLNLVRIMSNIGSIFELDCKFFI